MGGEQISDLANRGGAAAVALTETYYFQRITQANGLPLLVLLITHLGVHVFIRYAHRIDSMSPQEDRKYACTCRGDAVLCDVYSCVPAKIRGTSDMLTACRIWVC